MNAQLQQPFKHDHARNSKLLAWSLVMFVSMILLGQPVLSEEIPRSVITDLSTVQWEPWKGGPRRS